MQQRLIDQLFGKFIYVTNIVPSIINQNKLYLTTLTKLIIMEKLLRSLFVALIRISIRFIQSQNKNLKFKVIIALKSILVVQYIHRDSHFN
ncbi:MAG: hypothetical protein UZ04_CHB001001724 [Chlorobi bacterium OLB4]|jgi:hypothetical protein|nr:MAG: hypothetical protein UZ04_CHB001001724 [Chlorobi bacterium OLB4]OQY77334.1 MAG: hypothetical protein B6D43_06905 [Ignavibacteriales bacterium UTCHB1]